MTAAPEPLELIRSHEVHQRVYADPDIFQLEMQRVFGHSWILLGHECQAAKPGDFFLGRVGLKPVIVTRDRQSQIRVFLNCCPHRGAAICAERSGHVTRFICPYHAWTFALDGKLLAMPLNEEYGDSFDRQAHGLAAAGEVALYRGFIFLRQRPGGVDLETFLGDTKAAFDNLIDRSPSQELEVLPMVQRYRVRANWKLIMENLNDALHSMYAHASAMSALNRLDARQKEQLHPVARFMSAAPPPEKMKQLTSICTEYGHSFQTGMLGGARREVPHDDHFELLARARGESAARQILGTDIHVTLVYPSAVLNPQAQMVRLVRPLSVNETELIFYVYRLKGAPERVLDNAREYCTITGSPASFVIVDDLEIYERCQVLYESGNDAWVSVDRGFGADTVADGGLRTDGTSEGYIRNQYAVWSRCMGRE